MAVAAVSVERVQFGGAVPASGRGKEGVSKVKVALVCRVIGVVAKKLKKLLPVGRGDGDIEGRQRPLRLPARQRSATRRTCSDPTGTGAKAGSKQWSFYI